ncbi:MAG: ATP-binding cassette domain-containing protein [Bacilli bacterium]|nr:ATP-binding cassette domain-containing protein [Bacilli bacterium]
MNIIEINNLSFRYKQKFIYDNFSLAIKRGSWVTIAGPNGAGKTTLVKLLAGLVNSYSTIKILGKTCDKKNYGVIRKEVGFVFDTPENFFACETVEDELAFSLENLAIAPETIRKKINEVSKLLRLDGLLKQNPYDLSGGEKQKVALGCALMLEPRILVLDEAFMMIDVNERAEILKILSEYNKTKRVTIVSFTHNLEEALYAKRLIILNEGKIVVDGNFPEVFNEERVMRKIGLEVPFAVELCQKLRVYGLIGEIDMNLERLVTKIWK